LSRALADFSAGAFLAYKMKAVLQGIKKGRNKASFFLKE
jgi:hypothetical protein